WEVWYRPTVDSIDSSTVLTTSVPTVTLTGLMPGVEYSVAVRGLCDIENYSPWCDTLLFTTQIIDTNTIDTTQTQGIRWLGNLDRFTRIMPNPAHDVVNVLSSYRLESVAVYDLTGRQLLEQPADGISTVVDVSALPRGTYIMAIRTQQGVATKKLVVADN
ncbi:MAG: T9SS type A sorting domain-containing protein, partial [Bacteroidales bacterium]|nr:T9SS type A sorting domain-containing protein [Bacteroidales bacterium]